MFTIYFDGSSLTEPGSAERLAYLAEAGHELVLVGPADDPAAGLATWAGHLTAVPDEPAGGSWFVTADPETCGDRRSGLRTMLVGPRTDQRPTRCDGSARDLREAVLGILAADAMD